MRPRVGRALLLLSVVGSACGNPGPYAEWKTFVAPGGEYRIRYLDPPWDLAEADDTRLHLRIPNNTESFAGIDSTVAPKYDLVCDVVGRAPLRNAQQARDAARRRGEEVVEPVRELVTRSGAEGFELITRQTSGERLYRRYAFVGRPGGGSVSLLFEAVPALDEGEVTEMIRSVDPDPEDG